MLRLFKITIAESLD